MDLCLSVYHITKHFYQQFLKGRQVQPRFSLALPLKTLRLWGVTGPMNNNSFFFLFLMQVWSTEAKNKQTRLLQAEGFYLFLKQKLPFCRKWQNIQTSKHPLLPSTKQPNTFFLKQAKQITLKYFTSDTANQPQIFPINLYNKSFNYVFQPYQTISFKKTGKSPWEIFP